MKRCEERWEIIFDYYSAVFKNVNESFLSNFTPRKPGAMKKT